MSPHTWAFDPEYAVKADELLKRICDIWKHETPPPDGITFSGGEPFDQAEAFFYLLSALRELRAEGIRDILVYSGYRADLLLSRHPELTELITALVDGEYEAGLDCDSVWKGSANQSLTLFQPEFAARYSSWAAEKKGDLQIVKSDGRIIIAGIPHQGFSFEFPTGGGDDGGSS